MNFETIVMQTSRHRNSPGFSLVELLVVIAIIAVLMGLMLPAVQRVREAANQSTCRNNLRQQGLALQSFHHSRGCFPPGFLFDDQHVPEEWVTFNTFPGWGWAAHMLPFIEQSALAQRLDWKKAVDDPDMDGVRQHVIKTFVCPSDSGAGTFAVLTLGNKRICDAATNSYAACFGAGGYIGEYPHLGNGVFYRNSRTRIAEIRDGTSVTIAVGERESYFCPTPWAGVVTDGTARTNTNAPSFLAAIEESPVLVLARTNPYPLNQDYSTPYDFFTPHPLAGLFLFADGSVRSLRYNLPEHIWRALGTRAGGETATESDF